MLTHTMPAREVALLPPRTRVADRAVPVPGGIAGLADAAPPALTQVLSQHVVRAGALDQLLERLPVAIVMTDRQGTMVYANAAGRALPLTDLPQLELWVGQALMTGETMREERIDCGIPGCTRRWLTVDILPVRGQSGEIAAALLTITDETTRIQATEWQPIVDSLMTL